MNLACRTWHWRAAAAFVGLAISASATAATSSTVVDLHPSPGVTQRILYVRPDAPIATVVALPGGSGVLGIAADGSVAVPWFPLYRTRRALADLGVAVALVDAASDRSVYGVTNVMAVVRWAQQQAEVPVWISGGSSSTNPAAAIANELPAGDRIGAVFFSPDVPLKPIVKQVQRPALVIYNATDPAQAAAAFYAALTAAPVKKLDALSGNSDTGCGTHLFEGLDVEFATRIGAFIAANNGATGAPTSVNPNQSGLSGSWANLATLGQGLQLDVVPNLHGAGRAHTFLRAGSPTTLRPTVACAGTRSRAPSNRRAARCCRSTRRSAVVSIPRRRRRLARSARPRSASTTAVMPCSTTPSMMAASAASH